MPESTRRGAVNPVRRLVVLLPKGTLVLSGFAVLNVVLGLVREMVFAHFLGASAHLDAFLVGLTIPRIAVQNMQEVTVAVMLPLYVALRSRGESEQAARVMRRWFGLLLGILVPASVVVAVVAEPLVGAMAPGFDAATRAEAALRLRQLLPYMVVMATAGVFKCVLDSHRRFAAPPLSQAVISACVAGACALGAASWGTGALVVGFTAGGAAAWALQAGAARRVDPNLVRSARAAGDPVALPWAAAGAMFVQSLATQGLMVVDRYFASGLGAGAVSSYNYALSLNAMFTTVISSAVATAVFPVLARHTAAERWNQALAVTARWSVRLVALAAVPIAVLIGARTWVVELVFGHGAFGPDHVQQTASALAVMPLGMAVTAVSTLFVRLLLALNKATVVAVVTGVALVLKAVFAAWLVPRWGLTGLAGSTVLAGAGATAVRCAWAWRIVRARRCGPGGRESHSDDASAGRL